MGDSWGKRVMAALSFPGILGSVLVSGAALAAGLVYKGAQGEAYSILNHFISELGQIGVSRAAPVFNAGLVAAGVLFMPFCAGVSLRLRTVPGWIAFSAGVLASAACAGVGFFPMNNIGPHIFFAMWFFRLGLVTVLLYGAAIITQPRRPRSASSPLPRASARARTVPAERLPRAARVPRAAALAGVPAVLAYSAFLFLSGMLESGGPNPLDAGAFHQRPSVWPLALLEWLVFFATILWFLLAALIQMGSRRMED